jgi:hypothetical protein
MLSFLQYLAEAIRPEIYDKVLRDMEKLKSINDADVFQWNEGWMEKEFRESPLDKDKKAMRLFIPHGTSVKIRIIRLLEKYGMTLLSYKEAKVVNPSPTGSWPLKIGAVLTDLVNNSGFMKKLGIVLNSNEDKKEAAELLRLFAKDQNNRDNDDGTVTVPRNEEPKWIVISRDPYDVAGMSTGREWSSCQDLEGSGKLCHYVPRDIMAGTLVAYLIRDSDKREVVRDGDVLRLPLSRILIKPYLNKNGETAFAMSPKQYAKTGNSDPIFPIVVKKWVDEFNKKRGTKGFFTVHPAVYMGYGAISQGMTGTQEISATEFEIDDKGNMVNVKKPVEYMPTRKILDDEADIEEAPQYNSNDPFSVFNIIRYMNRNDIYIEGIYDNLSDAMMTAFGSFDIDQLRLFLDAYTETDWRITTEDYVYIGNIDGLKVMMEYTNADNTLRYLFKDRDSGFLNDFFDSVSNEELLEEFKGKPLFAYLIEYEAFVNLSVIQDRILFILQRISTDDMIRFYTSFLDLHATLSGIDYPRMDEIEVELFVTLNGLPNYAKQFRYLNKLLFEQFHPYIWVYIFNSCEKRKRDNPLVYYHLWNWCVDNLTDDELFMIVRENRDEVYRIIDSTPSVSSNRKIMSAIKNAVDSDSRPYSDHLSMHFDLKY